MDGGGGRPNLVYSPTSRSFSFVLGSAGPDLEQTWDLTWLDLIPCRRWNCGFQKREREFGIWAVTNISWATNPPHPITFKHEGGL